MRSRVLLLALVAMLLTAACSANPSEDGSEQQDAAAAFVAYARCMRANGVDMADPKVEEQGDNVAVRMSGPSVDVNSDTYRTANEACRKHLPTGPADGGAIDPEQQRQMQENLLKFARCMRAHGIDMPDPTFDGGAARVMAPHDASTEGEAKRQRAEAACRSLMPGNGAGVGTASKAGDE